MGKVRLTKEQADAVKSIKDTDYAINIHGLNKRPDSSLQELTTAELARALYVGYEVEPEYSVGDWIVVDYGEHGTEVGIIKGWIDKPHSFFIDKCHFGANVNEARHATPEEIAKEKERRWWNKHGRDVWELKTKDILKFGKRILVVTNVDHNKVYFKEDGWNYLSNLDEGWSVICFAEDRKDIDAE